MTDKPQASTTPSVSIEDVTPAMADAWLAKNPGNRHVRRPVADAYTRDMQAGSWFLNGESVKLDRHGTSATASTASSPS